MKGIDQRKEEDSISDHYKLIKVNVDRRKGPRGGTEEKCDFIDEKWDQLQHTLRQRCRLKWSKPEDVDAMAATVNDAEMVDEIRTILAPLLAAGSRLVGGCSSPSEGFFLADARGEVIPLTFPTTILGNVIQQNDSFLFDFLLECKTALSTADVLSGALADVQLHPIYQTPLQFVHIRDDKSIARHHASISFRDGICSVEALTPLGMFVDGEKYLPGNGSVTLLQNSSLQIGSKIYLLCHSCPPDEQMLQVEVTEFWKS